MPYVLIIHEVADYPAWKAIFDGAAGIRRDAGELAYQVLKYDTDPNRIVHFSQWRSLDAARAFFESERLIQIAPGPASRHRSSSISINWKAAC